MILSYLFNYKHKLNVKTNKSKIINSEISSFISESENTKKKFC